MRKYFLFSTFLLFATSITILLFYKGNTNIKTSDLTSDLPTEQNLVPSNTVILTPEITTKLMQDSFQRENTIDNVLKNYNIDTSNFSGQQKQIYKEIIDVFNNLDTIKTIKYKANGGDEFSSEELVVEDLIEDKIKTVYSSCSNCEFGEEEFPIVVLQLKDKRFVNCTPKDPVAMNGIYTLRDLFLHEFVNLTDPAYTKRDLIKEELYIDGKPATKYIFIFASNPSISNSLGIVDIVNAEIGAVDHESYLVVDSENNILEMKVTGGYYSRSIQITDRNFPIKNEFDC